MKEVLLLLLLLQTASTFAQTRVAMLAIATNMTDEFQLEPYEVAELKSSFDYTANGPSSPGISLLEIRKGTTTFVVTSDKLSPLYNVHRGPIVFTGPATVTLKWPSAQPYATATAFATFEIKPESFPPDKTFNLPAGTGARVALECSTNLTQWAELYSVTETNSPTHKFFRIKAERLP